MRFSFVLAVILLVSVSAAEEPTLQEYGAQCEQLYRAKCDHLSDASAYGECVSQVAVGHPTCSLVLYALGIELDAFVSCQVLRQHDSAYVCGSDRQLAGSRLGTPTVVRAPVTRSYGANFADFCSDIAALLPSFCNIGNNCDEEPGIMCEINLFNLDDIFVGANINLCASPINLNFTIADYNLPWLSYSTSVDASEDFAVPGVSISIPGVGSAGLDITVELDSTSSGITVGIGAEACLKVLGFEKCFPSPPVSLLNVQTPLSFDC